MTSGLRSRSRLNNGHRTRLAARKEAVKQTLLDTPPNLDDHRFEDGCRTMDVGSWLRSLGLGQYEAAFSDNSIDAEVLPDLTDSDLDQLGVLWATASACSRRSRS